MLTQINCVFLALVLWSIFKSKSNKQSTKSSKKKGGKPRKSDKKLAM